MTVGERSRGKERSGRALLGLLAAGLVAAAAPGWAEPPGWRPPKGPPPHGPPPPERFLEEHAERLGLDEETRAAIRGIAESSRARADAARDELDEEHAAMRELLEAEEPDVEAVMAQAERIGERETELRKIRLGAMLDIRRLLTPEQRAEMVRIREELGPPRWHRDRHSRESPPEEPR